MRKVATFLLVTFVLISAFALAEKGPMPDKVYFDVRMQQDVAIQDVVIDNSNILCHWGGNSVLTGECPYC
ncbi:hypothetical protein X927_07550 [Petrotoga mexicana DSM 14811]|uniref:Uncharacterized protein n=1 Tax=Petrotoga mexicana DSM 14811 TaxID=1122954 RepID=A0A2K1P7T0_9BACT|nr:hypothetical protein [Petrotoga mexicana]PNR98841.1 hypothetical protein X927_07550 [Petrotoga mexicana DSM 14811]